MPVTVRSFAKINLGLRIGSAREDGFHELLTVYQTIGLHDLIRVAVERGTGIEIQCADPRVPRDESNTCFRIAAKAMTALRAKGRVVIEIEKRLPVQGGMGGASSNAVATLLGLERALRKALSAAEKLKIAAEVGSDLPLFLVGGTVLGVGRGEQVYPLSELPTLACVVVTPEVGVSTPKAFAEWDRVQGQKPVSLEGPDAARSTSSGHALKGRSSTVGQAAEFSPRENAGELRSLGQPGAAVPTQAKPKLTVADASDRMNLLGRGLSAWLSGLYSGAPSGLRRGGRAENPLLWLVRAGIENDFERVVFPEYPELSEGKGALLRAGAKYASLSGSGSTLYGLFASREAAGRAAGRLRKQGWAVRATATLTRRAYWKRVVG
ncbi:MAG TPA: 4-(cytidine 5'-diphospho)-2-C-methyl-D-erythritol kinase [Candidatus Sulfotelmatobacter sp.]|jgi:4-diphosphocytidyl-2-C-methyl-D-erythritol kinase|nr:4-(cytidine 5'-diphospho)-2-C-methyl-D-erythritol kinase [Candidatus Sulfotelmatobacter sp.]